jgi:phage repressor protein C with HTH and peptisase S24 domain
MDAYHLNTKSFALRIDLTPNKLTKILNGHSNITLDFLYSISSSFPDVSIGWLANEEGPYPISIKRELIDECEEDSYIKSRISLSEFDSSTMSVYVYDSHGRVVKYQEPGSSKLDENGKSSDIGINVNSKVSDELNNIRAELKLNESDTTLMHVKGDGMHPTIKDGAMIMIEKGVDQLTDGVFVIKHDTSLLVKRLHILPTGVIKVLSDNKVYEPYEIDKSVLEADEVEILGRVVWSGQRI